MKLALALVLCAGTASAAPKSPEQQIKYIVGFVCENSLVPHVNADLFTTGAIIYVSGNAARDARNAEAQPRLGWHRRCRIAGHHERPDDLCEPEPQVVLSRGPGAVFERPRGRWPSPGGGGPLRDRLRSGA